MMGKGTTVVCYFALIVRQGVMKGGVNGEHEALERGGLASLQ
jgi:hypothetical protein